MIPVLLEDISRQMKDWGREGAVNPFREVHDVCLFFDIFCGAVTHSAKDYFPDDDPSRRVQRARRGQGRRE